MSLASYHLVCNLIFVSRELVRGAERIFMFARNRRKDTSLAFFTYGLTPIGFESLMRSEYGEV